MSGTRKTKTKLQREQDKFGSVLTSPIRTTTNDGSNSSTQSGTNNQSRREEVDTSMELVDTVKIDFEIQ